MRIVIAKVPQLYADVFPFADGDAMLLLGEIENMPDHVAVVTKDGRVLWGYHPEDFREPTEDEI